MSQPDWVSIQQYAEHIHAHLRPSCKTQSDRQPLGALR